MAICQFYQRGTCRYGDSCRNEHPGSARDSNRGSGGFGSTSNRFNGFGGGGDRYRPGQQTGAFGARSSAPSFNLNKDDIKADLTDQRPIYPLSCYGPGRDAPRQLIEGPLEISPEELRFRYYTHRAAGNEAAGQQEETALANQMQQQVQRILSDLDGAIKYIMDGADVHPNRIDIAQGKAKVGGTQSNAFGTGAPSPSPFGQPNSTFGRPSVPGQTTTAFPGAGTFGKPSLPGTSAFGQPSALGGDSAFGKPSTLGGGTAFGKPSMPGAGSVFGQTTAPGQPSGTTPGFGTPSMPGQASAFGQTNVLGQPSAFGKPSFGTSAFGQPSQPNAGTSPFAQQAPKPSIFGQSQAQPQAQATQPSIFGQQQPQQQAPSQASVFGQPQQQAAAAPKPFLSQPTQASAFGTPAFGQPFGTQPPAQQAPARPSPFAQQPQGQATAPSLFAPSQQAAAPSSLAGQLQPQSAPGSAKPIEAKERFKEGRPEQYEGEQGQKLEEIYRRVGQTGKFLDDELIPLVPPKCEWITPLAVS
ncbi:uncharacterized protein EI97DRAFT_465632 [Westerdykella ornata]|uniref:C3H1-type domain-containing protein n=1 Tax=Westerdykella ornata TaxID=318751 RepID=A0A6A6JQA8_WESOR|nr:uncharacterized protein EI97DRAFT_465632 [Westerdykella ornata]KAF2278303.1 hypothetical protein EI97DRAFT_465632 [Westerdykella ornata]